MQVEAWLQRAALLGADGHRDRDPGGASCPIAELLARRARERASCASAACAAASVWRSRCRPGSRSRRLCTRACCSAPSRCRSTCASPPPSASAIVAVRRARRASRLRGRRAPSTRDGRGGSPSGCESARSRRGLRGDPHLRHHLGAAADRADLRQLPVERARLGCRARRRPARALAVRAAALPRGRPVDPRAQRDLCHHRGRPRALRHRRACCTRCDEERITLVSLVATTLARLLDAGLRDPPTLRCALTGGGPVPPRSSSARAPRACRCVETYGLTEACSQVDHRRRSTRSTRPGRRAGGPPLFCTRTAIAADGEILVGGPTVAPGALARGRPAAHRRSRRARRATASCASAGARPTRSSAAARTSRRARSRRCSKRTPRCSRRRCSDAPTRSGGRPSRRSSWLAPGASLAEAMLREHCAGAPGPLQGAKAGAARLGPLPRTRSGKLLRRELQGISR